mmetsp:Transcript_9469/g.32088  ORF Transcript_9469/g.32088 Transcript_9469/m.32088 type:complete len:220 (-) Transcript_9469:347-1006(-)
MPRGAAWFVGVLVSGAVPRAPWQHRGFAGRVLAPRRISRRTLLPPLVPRLALVLVNDAPLVDGVLVRAAREADVPEHPRVQTLLAAQGRTGAVAANRLAAAAAPSPVLPGACLTPLAAHARVVGGALVLDLALVHPGILAPHTPVGEPLAVAVAGILGVRVRRRRGRRGRDNRAVRRPSAGCHGGLAVTPRGGFGPLLGHAPLVPPKVCGAPTVHDAAE